MCTQISIFLSVHTHLHKYSLCHVYICNISSAMYIYVCTDMGMGWLRLVGSLKSYVSLTEYSLFYRALLQTRPIILRSLLIVATLYILIYTSMQGDEAQLICTCTFTHLFKTIRTYTHTHIWPIYAYTYTHEFVNAGRRGANLWTSFRFSSEFHWSSRSHSDVPPPRCRWQRVGGGGGGCKFQMYYCACEE